MTTLDLLVVGGGPAGLATALHAARAGLEVTVWEQRAGVIDKACGEGLMPGAVDALERLGVCPSGLTLTGIRYLDGHRQVEAPFRAGPGRGVRRTVLHSALRDAVAQAGVAVERRTARRLVQDDRVVDVDGTRARYVVAADGLHSPVRRLLGLAGEPVAHRRFGQRAHFRTTPWTSFVEVHWSSTAEAYVTPVGSDLVGVAVLSSVRMPFEQHLRAFPALADHLVGLVPETGIRGAGPLHQRVRGRVAGRVLLVGDAAGYVDALTGEGIALALAQARAAVGAVLDEEPQRYEHEWRAITRRYRWLTAGLLGATRVPPLRRALVPSARRLPRVFAAAVDSLARPA